MVTIPRYGRHVLGVFRRQGHPWLSRRTAVKALAALSIAIATIGLSPLASAQTRVMGPHAETAAALACLLEHRHKECSERFVGSARPAAQYWLWWTPDKDFELGPQLSSDYAGTEAVNAYLTKFLNGRKADVYDVKFRHHEKTFYIVPPGPDGKIQYMRVRGGAPDDENMYLFGG